MTINILTIECAGVAGISARNDAAGQAFTKVTLENVPRFELMAAIQSTSTIEEILTHITNHDIELYMKGQGNE